jgi:hypothetical protein
MSSAADTTATIIPCLRYRDALAAIDWLCRAFGWWVGPTPKVEFAGVTKST